MAMVKWDEVRDDFEPDGGLRDIYVTSASGAVWDQALGFMLQTGTARYSIDDADAPLPASAADALRLWPDRSPLLILDREGIEYACHFFGPDRVELDFWPEDVRGPDEFAALTRFVVGLGRATDRLVLVTYESSEAAEIFRYVPETDTTEAGPLASRRPRG
jgi:hypothetical protein